MLASLWSVTWVLGPRPSFPCLSSSSVRCFLWDLTHAEVETAFEVSSGTSTVPEARAYVMGEFRGRDCFVSTAEPDSVGNGKHLKWLKCRINKFD